MLNVEGEDRGSRATGDYSVVCFDWPGAGLGGRCFLLSQRRFPDEASKTSITTTCPRPQHNTMASKLVPFACRSASRALRVQRPQWRAFSVAQPRRSDNLMVVSTSSVRPSDANCTADTARSTAILQRTTPRFPSSSPNRMSSSSRRLSRDTPPTTRRPPSCLFSISDSASTDSAASAL
jgi:hypothetical protein